MVDFSRLSFSVWMRCPKHVGFCFHISTSHVHGGLISSSTDLFVTEGGRRLCFHPCLSVSLCLSVSVCLSLFVCLSDISKSFVQIQMKLGGQVGSVKMINLFDFGGDLEPDTLIYLIS